MVTGLLFGIKALKFKQKEKWCFKEFLCFHSILALFLQSVFDTRSVFLQNEFHAIFLYIYNTPCHGKSSCKTTAVLSVSRSSQSTSYTLKWLCKERVLSSDKMKIFSSFQKKKKKQSHPLVQISDIDIVRVTNMRWRCLSNQVDPM